MKHVIVFKLAAAGDGCLKPFQRLTYKQFRDFDQKNEFLNQNQKYDNKSREKFILVSRHCRDCKALSLSLFSIPDKEMSEEEIELNVRSLNTEYFLLGRLGVHMRAVRIRDGMLRRYDLRMFKVMTSHFHLNCKLHIPTFLFRVSIPDYASEGRLTVKCVVPGSHVYKENQQMNYK